MGEYGVKLTRFGSIDLTYDGVVLVRGIDKDTIVEMNNGRLICGKYKLPIKNAIEYADVKQSLFFIFDTLKMELYSVGCKRVLFSSRYSDPIIEIDDGEYSRIERFEPDAEGKRKIVCYISEDEKVITDEEGYIYLEKYAYSGIIALPRKLKEDYTFCDDSKKSVISKYVWKNINYRLIKHPVADYTLRECCLRPTVTSIDCIRKYIRDIEQKSVSREVSEFYKKTKEGNGRSLDVKPENVDNLLHYINSVIEKMENEEAWKNASEDDFYFEENITDRYIDPRIYSSEILKELYDFVDILENELGVDITVDITYLLYRCISLCRKVFPITNGVTFPCSRFNVFFRRIIKDFSEESDRLNSLYPGEVDQSDLIYSFAETLLDDNVRDDDIHPFVYEYLDKHAIREDRPYGIYLDDNIALLDNIYGNFIGFVSFVDNSTEPNMDDCIRVECGQVNERFEIHSPEKSFLLNTKREGRMVKCFEIYYDLAAQCYCINNRDRIDEDIIAKAVNKIEADDDFSYNIVLSDCNFVNIDEENENQTYYGYVYEGEDGQYCEVKEKISSIEDTSEDVIYLSHEADDEIIHEVGYSWRDGKSIIISNKFDKGFLNMLKESFNIKKWKWQRREVK